LAAGVESVENVSGTSGGYGRSIIHADWTHSMVGALVLAALSGLVAGQALGPAGRLVLGAVVFSHWLLDLIVHRADMPILPGNAGHLPRLGFGLWKAPAASILVELVLVVAGAWLYWRAAVHTRTAEDRRANLMAGLLLVAGLITLGLDALVA
jgi:membrane-bound metal-dependent hydrolase YbcI (DUF457 family)